MDIHDANKIAGQLLNELKKVIVGQDNVIIQMLVGYLAGGHIILEGVPGTAKTLLSRSLGFVTKSTFKRLQLTPDLMPADITGVNIFNMSTNEFTFRQGPIFSDLVLADEINRAPAKTQSALLEAMEEMQVSIDGQTHDMSSVFTVIATQNPVEFEGTYPLPEAQLDRFMLKILVDYPSEEHEASFLDMIEEGFDAKHLNQTDLQKTIDTETLLQLRHAVKSIRSEEMTRRYITQIIRATRNTHAIALGASPRAAGMLLLAAKAYALIMGRDFVTPDDIKTIAYPVLRHRVILRPEVEVEGRSVEDCIQDLLVTVEVPR